MAKKEPLTILINDLVLNTHLHMEIFEFWTVGWTIQDNKCWHHIVLEGIVSFFVMFHRLCD